MEKRGFFVLCEDIQRKKLHNKAKVSFLRRGCSLHFYGDFSVRFNIAVVGFVVYSEVRESDDSHTHTFPPYHVPLQRTFETIGSALGASA